MFRVVSVEDDSAICELLQNYFESLNYKFFNTAFGTEAIKLIKAKKPDIILLDWMLSDIDGIRLIKKIRDFDAFNNVPIIMLTAKSDELDVVKGLEKGADDYLTKPFSLAELNARINSLLRRAHGFDKKGEISIGKIKIDPERFQLIVKKKQIKINLNEFRLLYFLMKNKNKIYKRSILLDEIWGNYAVIDERTVDVTVLRIRKILKKFNLEKKIQTIRGVGYSFSE